MALHKQQIGEIEMYQTITRSQFRDAFRDKGRQDQFSYEALGALYDWLEESYDGKFELDVIALCCEWAEDSIENVLSNYNLDSLEDLQNETTVIELNGDTILYQQY